MSEEIDSLRKAAVVFLLIALICALIAVGIFLGWGWFFVAVAAIFLFLFQKAREEILEEKEDE